MPGAAHGLHEVIHRPRRHAMNIVFLDDGCQRLFHRALRLEKAREVGASAQARDEQLYAADPRLPVAIAIAVTLRQSLKVLLALVSAGLGANLEAPSDVRRQRQSSHVEGRHLRSSPPALGGS